MSKRSYGNRMEIAILWKAKNADKKTALFTRLDQAIDGYGLLCHCNYAQFP